MKIVDSVENDFGPLAEGTKAALDIAFRTA
jgi:hypothetical protein